MAPPYTYPKLLAVIVQFDNQAARGFDRPNLNVLAFDITSSDIGYIWVPQACETLKEEDIAYSF